MGGLAGGRGCALQVLSVGGQVCVLILSILSQRCMRLVWGWDAMLTNRRTLEGHGVGLQGLPTAGGLLLGLKKTLVPSWDDWNF